MTAPKVRASKVEPVALRLAMAKYATGVSIVTTLAPDHKPAGLTITSFNSLSLEPPLVLWSLGLTSSNLDVFKSSGKFAVNVLSTQLLETGRKFSRSDIDKFSDVPVTLGQNGLPLIDGALVQMECVTEAQYPAGDHVLFLGRVINTSVSEGEPLVFYNSTFGALANAY